MDIGQELFFKNNFECFHWRRKRTGRLGRKPGHGRTAALGGIDFWIAVRLFESTEFLDFAPRGPAKQLDRRERNIWALQASALVSEALSRDKLWDRKYLSGLEASALEDFGRKSLTFDLISVWWQQPTTVIANSDCLSTLSSPSWEHKIRKE